MPGNPAQVSVGCVFVVRPETKHVYAYREIRIDTIVATLTIGTKNQERKSRWRKQRIELCGFFRVDFEILSIV